MSEQHTPGLLETDGRSIYTAIVGETGPTNVAYCGSAIGRDAECAANARRIVACWNALDGLATEDVESGAVKGMACELVQVRAVKAEMLAALTEMLPHASGAVEQDQRPWIVAARAAIATAEKARSA